MTKPNKTDAALVKARGNASPPKRPAVASSLPPAAPDDPPFLEFWKRTKDTLPERIGEPDLSTLNSAIGFLFRQLRLARAQFEREGDDAGRDAAYTALGAFHMFVTLFRKTRDEALHVPIVRLQDGLLGLQQGRIDAMLRPTRHPGRAHSSQTYLALKGLAAATVQLLLQTGLAPRDAHRAVAKQLAQLDIRAERGSGAVTATTVRNWYVEVSSDVGRRGAAALMWDDILAFEKQEGSLPEDVVRRIALEHLATWVRDRFPDKKLLTPPI
jgi:hypothetical protein